MGRRGGGGMKAAGRALFPDGLLEVFFKRVFDPGAAEV